MSLGVFSTKGFYNLFLSEFHMLLQLFTSGWLFDTQHLMTKLGKHYDLID